MITSGIRLGTPAGTTRGFGTEEFKLIGEWIGDVLDGLVESPEGNAEVEQRVRKQVKELCKRFPLYR
jgi:glycine hydroxymethyltransferase